MKVNIGTYSFGGIATFLGLGPTLKEKFEKIASLGYTGVELLEADLNTNSVEDIKKWADEAGIEVVSCHAKPTEEIVKKMAALGGKAVIWAGTPFCNKAEAIEVAQEMDAMAEMAEPYGIKIGYHNHSQEFFVDEGKTLLQHMLDNSTKVYSQLDCGWAQNGGCYPPTFIRKYKNRILAIHVKENSRVQGPGPRPASRHDEQGGRPPMPNPAEMPIEERQKILEQFTARQNSPEEKKRFEVQCKMGAPESNIKWQDIKDALDEQDFEAFWVVEREGFYDEHDQCLADDCKYIKENVK